MWTLGSWVPRLGDYGRGRQGIYTWFRWWCSWEIGNAELARRVEAMWRGRNGFRILRCDADGTGSGSWRDVMRVKRIQDLEENWRGRNGFRILRRCDAGGTGSGSWRDVTKVKRGSGSWRNVMEVKRIQDLEENWRGRNGFRILRRCDAGGTGSGS
jgi:Rieske Fe-S protein